MVHQVVVRPSGHTFAADADESVLAAALRQGLSLPYGCRDGVCGSCRARVLSGEVAHGNASIAVLGEADRLAGFALLCCAVAKTDLCIESREASSLADIPVRTLPARVHRLVRAAPEVMIVELRLPSSERLQFLAGQYVDILLKDGKRRSFSLANAPHDDGLLQLHVRRIAGGRFTEHVFAGMRERDLLRLRGPLGSFFLRDESSKPMLLVAGGTGFAPIKAIVEHALAQGSTRPMDIYWGARQRTDLYLLQLAEQWAMQHRWIRFVPVLSESPPADGWQGRTGLVHAAAMRDHPDLSQYQAYVCGAPVMVAAARKDFLAHCQLPADEFFADSFDYAAETQEAIATSAVPEMKGLPHE
ncbi:MAG TPA: CDP-6-deoxy-delta-3,4-glucoseen reductase [Candidatus Accumulibacter phosphatis]|nr:MAG: CDP-6-deoxy-L-threo-D-glycero-4-hexulose-3-dehydrase reductase [Candidatus Accumulibacter sp. SK-11]HAY27661.1 CDP-6-deoxy-delta-3,4-glucoseen reductase [Accumulibacter sp.]HRL75008.1 CDP-6-deoxy-delta-3,4-glucoseen reductase [Candidatus Accumulibacter phosphatis]HCN67717.1 CDP-6-deoxy-delta-3,4-glucoseen reductase [Accumulibacter sp.]HCV14500.1 CDP-6-deoxy-delta-3,4-glucoseen reductase [Accumulibacter sp.]